MTNERKRQLGGAVLKLREGLPQCSQPKMAEQLGYDDKQTIYRYEKFGPPAEALPRLAALARVAGEEDLAREFLDAFLDEFPDLRALVRTDPYPGTHSTDAEAEEKHIRKAETLAFSGIKEERSRELHDLLDQVLAFHKEAVVGPLEATMRLILELAAPKEKCNEGDS